MNDQLTRLFLFLITSSLFFLTQKVSAETKSVSKEKEIENKTASSSKNEGKSAPEYKTIKLEKKRIKKILSVNGFFEDPDAVPFSVETRVWNELKVIQSPDHGNFVKKNEQVVSLETEKLSQKLNGMKHELKILSLDGDILSNELKRDEKVNKIELAELTRTEKYNRRVHSHFKELDLPYEKKSAINELKRYEENLLYMVEELNQLKKMYESDDLTEETEEIIITRTQNDVNRYKFALEGAQMRKNKRLSLEIPKMESDKQDLFQKQNLTLTTDKINKPLALNKKKLEMQKIQENKKNLITEIRKLEKDVLNLKALSPISGTIFLGTFQRGKWSGLKPFESKVKKGGILKPHEEFATICPLKRIRARINIPEKNYADLIKVKTGILKSTINPDTEINCKFDKISNFPISPDHYDLAIDVELPENMPLPLPGTSCTFDVITYEKMNASTLPETSVFKEDHDAELRFVYILSPKGKPIKKRIKVGKTSGLCIEVLSGLKPSQEVLKDKPGN